MNSNLGNNDFNLKFQQFKQFVEQLQHKEYENEKKRYICYLEAANLLGYKSRTPLPKPFVDLVHSYYPDTQYTGFIEE